MYTPRCLLLAYAATAFLSASCREPQSSPENISGQEETYVFPQISDDDLLTEVQRRTFAYFWNYAHPVSGLARERTGSGDTVTTGGSGFGLMTIPVAVERGFISREEALTRVTLTVDFLLNKATRFHGAYPHWINGGTGAVIPFSAKDNGADLVETAYLIQGLLTLKHYFSSPSEQERLLRESIDEIWHSVEWDWFTRGGNDALYWHWSPDYGWDMNMKIRGWNECLIVYVLAASSPTHPISREVYDNGWTRNGKFVNGNQYFSVTLPLGEGYGGPLFFAHYSFLGLCPSGLSDKYADYWAQNVAHSRINYNYCVNNPKHWTGYSDKCWGLTASDYWGGYTASSPTNDVGTIAPTAAISSLPYTPLESLEALRYFYYIKGNRLFGVYGFKDAFCPHRNWYASGYLAIDQGPIVIMIENYRTGLLWNLFMSDTDVLSGLSALGFTVRP